VREHDEKDTTKPEVPEQAPPPIPPADPLAWVPDWSAGENGTTPPKSPEQTPPPDIPPADPLDNGPDLSAGESDTARPEALPHVPAADIYGWAQSHGWHAGESNTTKPEVPEQAPPAASPGRGPDWRAGESGNSPYSKRNYSVYVRKSQPPPPGTYQPGSMVPGQPHSGYQYGAVQPHSASGQNQWSFNEYHQALPNTNPRKKRSRGLVVAGVVVLGVVALSVLAFVGYNAMTPSATPIPPPQIEDTYEDTTPTPVPRPQPPSPSGEVNLRIESRPPGDDTPPVVGELMTVPQVAQVVRPSVVGIINYRSGRMLRPDSEGSGIIVTENGYIVTNAHVVERAQSLVVVFEDMSEYEALLVGYDTRTDIAVLRVDRTGLPAAVLGNSDQLEVGETVVAIGNPGGVELAGSVTRGIVSAVNRVVSTPYDSTIFIQTDAAINPGNSGGPLSNEFGQVIGINTAKIVELGYEGIGFAIPMAYAIPIIEELILHGRVTGRVLLGITGEIVSDGVQIVTISSDGLIDNGVQTGDIITHMDGQEIRNLNDIRAVLDTKRAEDTVELTIHRPSRTGPGETFTVTVPLIEDLG